MPLTPTDYTPNPYVPWAWIRVGGAEITLSPDGRPEHLISFQHHMASNAAGTFTAVLFDPQWTYVEDLLIANKQDIQASYGYQGARKSPVYQLQLLSYTPKFQNQGVQITFQGISRTILSTDERLVSQTYKDKDLHEIVQQIASENGWQADVDETLPVYDNSALDSANLVKASFTQKKMKDVPFIREVLAPRAVRKKDKVGNYQTYFDDATNTLHFHPPKFEAEVIRHYIFMRDRMSEVINFAPEIDGGVRVVMGAGVAAAPVIDHQTGETTHVEHSDASTPEKILLGGQYTQVAAPDEERAMVVENRPLRDADAADIAARNRFYEQEHYLYPATAIIQGDPLLVLQKLIDMTVISSSGQQHYTSGVYLIQELLHVVSDGTYQTTLTLHRNAAGKGDDAGTGSVRAS